MKKRGILGILACSIICVIAISILIPKDASAESIDKSNIVTNEDDKETIRANTDNLFNVIDGAEKKGNNKALKLESSSKKLSLDTEKIQKIKGDFNDNRFIVDNEQMLVEFNEEKEPITYIKKEKITSEKMESKKQLKSVVSTESIANEIINDIAPDSVLKFKSNLHNGYIDYTYSRTFSGYRFDQDFIKIIIDEANGEVVTISKRFLSQEPEIDIKISIDDAKKIAQELLSKNDIKSSNTIIVNPNGMWRNMDTIFTETSSNLAYEIVFANKDTVWVDTKTGSLLGGTKIRE